MYSLELRQMTVNIYKKLKSFRKTALLTNISKSTIQRWTKNVNLNIRVSRKSKLNSPVIIQIISTMISNIPFISMLEIKKKLLETLNLNVSTELIRLFVKKTLKKTYKKPHFYPLPNEEKLLQKTVEFKNKFQEHMANFLHSTIVSLDEVGFSSNVRYTKGWHDKGSKLQVKYKPSSAEKKHKSACTLITSTGFSKYSLIDNHFNTTSFMEFVSTLDFPNNTLILLDNVSFHHSKKFVTYAVSKGWNILYTPPYSPQFNPIELVFSQVKRNFRKSRIIKESFSLVTPQSIINCINHVIEKE